MIISKEQQEQLLEAAKPLIKWLNENGHPHVRAIVDCTAVEMLEGVATGHTSEFVRD